MPLLGGVAAVGLALVGLVAWMDRARAVDRRQPPAEVLRARYSRGQLTREQDQTALVDLLKDRYVRGEIDVAAYEAALGRLLDEPRQATLGPTLD